MKQNFIVLFVMFHFITSAQNNAIFTGGNADGWSSNTYSESANNIFTGGNGSGWNKTVYVQSSNNIFTGGNGDGWDKSIYLQSGNSIFTGGNDDGWSSVNFLQPGNDIFNGGNADGWDKSIYLQLGNNIFTGGEGDGWSSTYRPSGPLPVNLLNFSVQKQNGNTSLIKWQTSSEVNSNYFIVERSMDAIYFTPVGSINAAGNSNTERNYSFVDQHPAKGFNYYRLKQVDRDDHFILTPSRVLKFDELYAESMACYPNPSKGLVNLKISEEIRMSNSVINISDEKGVVVAQWKLKSGFPSPLQLNLSRLSKGIYFIHLNSGNISTTSRIVLY